MRTSGFFHSITRQMLILNGLGLLTQHKITRIMIRTPIDEPGNIARFSNSRDRDIWQFEPFICIPDFICFFFVSNIFQGVHNAHFGLLRIFLWCSEQFHCLFNLLFFVYFSLIGNKLLYKFPFYLDKKSIFVGSGKESVCNIK